MKDLWTKFIETGEIEDGLDKIIAESWRRCTRLGVDPKAGFGKTIDSEKLEVVLKRNEELLRVAKPIMQNLNELVLGSNFILVLTDKEGVIIETIGEEPVRKEANTLNFCVGALWSEKEVGTNAIGTSIIVDKPIHTTGSQHYCEYHHSWTCSAAPIHDNKGNIIGVLDMSGSFDKLHKHTLGIVVAAAYSIENEIRLLRTHELVDTTVESISDGMIIADKDFKINKINYIASKILGIEEDNKLDIREILRETDFQEILTQKHMTMDYMYCNFFINDKVIPCNVKITPVLTNNELIGIALVFKEIEYLHNTVNVVTGNRAIYRFSDILTSNDKMKNVINNAKRFAKTSGSILIEGDSGTGKELFAHAIHNYSKKADGPFVAVNCASLPRELVESELFGYEKGAFTGASKDGKSGKFELAQGGTIFLDEIGELPLDIQAKLLRVLDNYTVTRIGGKYSKKLDIRVIGATNRNLFDEVKKKNFREDLYYRLNVLKINIPSLKDRREDIDLYANYFLDKLNKSNSTNVILSSEFLLYLNQHSWKGNVRELQNVIERAYYLNQDEVIGIECLPEEIINEIDVVEKKTSLDLMSIRETEKHVIINALKKTKGHVINAGDILNLSKSTIYRKINEHKIDVNIFK
ncbi:sigma-54-dependent Fis family transcriptional regulator [uncultured Tissierella sp.]|uniref:sigma-54-dependent Fis family transcriptional regulator n=1 Tax=uncultured Tissierella sp. TaxID=448160 RepID=UPI002804C138|nr:sigma-54-dependent Fis family transcriptional regulator [uncultured Tissierella sp.]MDU5082946.1 sigma-54-dependent Fis family transcriptional regulator [Bacillota bacterium]